MEANRKAMEEMENQWKKKLEETQVREEQAERLRDEEEIIRHSGLPHLTNLNEDSILDRKVFYDIKEEEALTCGRRNK